MRDKIEEHYTENFDRLVKRYNRRCGGEMNSEDVVQEAYCRALKYSNSFREDLNTFDKWFGGIISNSFIAFKQSERPLPPPEAEGVGPTAEDLLLQRVAVQKIKEEIDKYKSPNKDVLWLWFFRQYTDSDIHNVTGVPKNTIKSYVKRFRDKMREQEEA